MPAYGLELRGELVPDQHELVHDGAIEGSNRENKTGENGRMKNNHKGEIKMKKLIAVLGIVLMSGNLFAGTTLTMPELQRLDAFVRQQLMIENQDMSYTINFEPNLRFNSMLTAQSLNGTEKLPFGTYTTSGKRIEWNGDETILVHEIAHHYGANEEVSRWVAWCWEDSRMSSFQRVLEIPLYTITTPFKWLSGWLNKLDLPGTGAWSEEENRRYDGSTEPWPQEQWRLLK
mgnify:CR=1 FL=1